MATFHPVAKRDEIEDGGMRQFVVEGRLVGVYRVGDDFFAIDDVCTHEEAYLTEGELDPEDMEVECPLHGSHFSVVTGEVRILPATRPVAAYEVKIEGDLVLVGPRQES